MFDVHTRNLANNLRVLLIDTKGLPSVSMLLLVGAGSRYEGVDNNGVAHFFEHMAFKGSKKYPDALTISSLVEGQGADFNAFTSKDYTGYYIKCTTDKTEQLFDVLADMIQAPNLDATEIEKERGVIIQELNMYEDSPRRKVSDVFDELVYDKTTLGMPIIGTKESLGKIDQAVLKEYLGKHYAPDNVVCILAGGLTSAGQKIDEYFKIIEEKLGKWPKGEFGKHPDVQLSTQTTSQVKIHTKKTEQAHVTVGFPAFGMDDPRFPALQMLTTILGKGMSSRLFARVREQAGLCYSIYAYPDLYIDTGTLNVYVGVEPSEEKVTLALEKIKSELEDISTKPVTDAEMKKAVDFMKGSLYLSLEDSFDVATFYGFRYLFLNKLRSPEEYVKRIESVTKADVQKLAKELFSSKPFVAAIGPFKKKDFVEKIWG